MTYDEAILIQGLTLPERASHLVAEAKQLLKMLGARKHKTDSVPGDSLVPGGDYPVLSPQRRETINLALAMKLHIACEANRLGKFFGEAKS